MIERIKQVRKITGAGVMLCREALEKSGGNIEKAVAYIHENTKIGKRCEPWTDEEWIRAIGYVPNKSK
ncbi:hypothetical protein P9578_28270 [Brevibacillus choshinensis]|uniref:hypothetical protein n=1 Tax=Brevibacillus choshinensis TaxID=54911 RepID=UPI002E1ED9A1|nr:hypothetical protein [Brevibacillus choshinensis]